MERRGGALETHVRVPGFLLVGSKCSGVLFGRRRASVYSAVIYCNLSGIYM